MNRHPRKNIELSKHMRDRLFQRKINLDDCKSVIKNYDKRIIQGDAIPEGKIIKFVKQMRGDRLTVVAIETEKKFILVTCFEEKNEND